VQKGKSGAPLFSYMSPIMSQYLLPGLPFTAGIDRASIWIQMLSLNPRFIGAQRNIPIGSMEVLSQSARSIRALPLHLVNLGCYGIDTMDRARRNTVLKFRFPLSRSNQHPSRLTRLMQERQLLSYKLQAMGGSVACPQPQPHPPPPFLLCLPGCFSGPTLPTFAQPSLHAA
jgi:hypothetical protein